MERLLNMFFSVLELMETKVLDTLDFENNRLEARMLSDRCTVAKIDKAVDNMLKSGKRTGSFEFEGVEYEISI
jgi:hypothetical protein